MLQKRDIGKTHLVKNEIKHHHYTLTLVHEYINPAIITFFALHYHIRSNYVLRYHVWSLLFIK